MFPKILHPEAVVQRGPRRHLVLAAELSNVYGTGFEDMRGNGEQLVTVRGQGRPLVEGTILVAVEVPTL